MLISIIVSQGCECVPYVMLLLLLNYSLFLVVENLDYKYKPHHNQRMGFKSNA